jgi:hypothetical protein
MDRHSDGGWHAGLDSHASASGDYPAAADVSAHVSRTPQAGDSVKKWAETRRWAAGRATGRKI